MALLINGIDDTHNYRVKIPFNEIVRTTVGINMWNETCATAIELFGLPGEKYTCRFTKTDIEFWFLDEKDAMMFELCCG